MVGKVELLADQLRATYDDPAWQPNLKDALENLTLDVAKTKTTSSAHSIFEIVSHLLYWGELWLARYNEENTDHFKRMDNDNTFHQNNPEMTIENWESSKLRLLEIFKLWYESVVGSSEERIHSKFAFKSGNEAVWWNIISNLILHNSYHIGQIISIRKQFENWVNKY